VCVHVCACVCVRERERCFQDKVLSVRFLGTTRNLGLEVSEISLLLYLVFISLRGLFLVINCMKGVLPKFKDSKFAPNHLFVFFKYHINVSVKISQIWVIDNHLYHLQITLFECYC
jgi:hypothetical protein